MPKIKILSDSTCDLSAELVEKYEIGLIPLYINLGGRVLPDGVSVSPDDIYAYVEKTGELPGTIASSIEDFRKAFQTYRDQGYEVICHTISSDMSCSFQNARIAAQEVDGVYVVDSRNLSSGVGHVVINAAIMARQGMAAADIVKELEAVIPKVSASFVIDTLDYMKKGGRCSSIMLLGANLLKIKPSILVKDGAMTVGQKYRGSLSNVLMEYVDHQLAGRRDIRTDRIFITHSGCDAETVDAVRARIQTHIAFEEIIETRAGCTISSHCGPNTLGILFVEK